VALKVRGFSTPDGIASKAEYHLPSVRVEKGETEIMCRLCWTLLVLLLLAVAGVAYKVVVTGKVEPGADGREAILLERGERNLVLKEMRGFLVAVQEIVAATNEGKMEEASRAASRAGMAATHDVPPTLMAKLPLGFKKLGLDTHRRFDRLALDARQLGDPDHTREQLATLMGNCVGCHAAYSLKAVE
jgi:cytochrome c556